MFNRYVPRTMALFLLNNMTYVTYLDSQENYSAAMIMRIDYGNLIFDQQLVSEKNVFDIFVVDPLYYVLNMPSSANFLYGYDSRKLLISDSDALYYPEYFTLNLKATDYEGDSLEFTIQGRRGICDGLRN